MNAPNELKLKAMTFEKTRELQARETNKNKNLERIGENIRATRKSKNLTIEALSELIDISPSFLGALERGDSSPSIDTLMRICKVLDVSADSILFNEDITDPLAVADEKEILQILLKNATSEELSFLIDYVRLYRGYVNVYDK